MARSPASVTGHDTLSILCDVSTGKPRLWIPSSWRRQVFDSIHGLSHPGTNTTMKMVVAKCIWRGLSKQVRDWARNCISCQRDKVHKHIRAPLANIETPSRRFDHIHVDIVGPLPTSCGFTHLFTIVDRFTRWPEAIPLSDISTKSCARALFSIGLQDMEFQHKLHPIVEPSLHPSCGLICAN